MLEDRAKPFLDHLDDLRSCLLGGLTCLAAGMAVVVPFLPRILDALRRPLRQAVAVPGNSALLQGIDVSESFSTAFQMAFWTGLMVSLPGVGFFLLRFLLPALRGRERRVVLGALGGGVLLFGLGVSLAYTVVLPVALQVMIRLNTWLGVATEWRLSSYVTFSSHLLLLFGLAFELPVVLLVLGLLGLVQSGQMRRLRSHVIVGIFVLAMILTPGPDVFSQVIMAVPMVILYELCIWVTWLSERRRQAELPRGT